MRKSRKRAYTKEKMQIANKYTKRCSSSPEFKTSCRQIKNKTKHFTWAKIKKFANVIDVGKWLFLNCKWEHNLVQVLTRTISQYLLSLNVHPQWLSNSTTHSLCGERVHKETCSGRLIGTVLAKAKNCKYPRWAPTGDCRSKLTSVLI